MGAWDFAVFDDDTAYDVLDDLKESSDIIRIWKSILMML